MSKPPFDWPGDGKPLFTEADIDKLLGKTVLIGITTLEADGTFVEQTQMHGVIEKADQHGIVVALKGKREGETWNMPPDMRAMQPAKAGEYQLRSTGEIVANPDFTATWTVHKPQRH